MTACTVPGCNSDAVLQWQRLATAEESGDETARHAQTQVNAVQRERDRHTAEIAELQHMTRLVEDSDQDPRAKQEWLDRAAAQIAAARAARDALVDPEPLPPPTDPTVVAVFACETHALDLETAAALHPAHCSTTGPCGCDVAGGPA